MTLHTGNYAIPSIPRAALAWGRFWVSGPVPSAVLGEGEEQIASLLLWVEA